MERKFEALKRLCKKYGYELVEDPAPCDRSDVMGTAGLQDEVQLCEGRVIAVGPHVHEPCLLWGVTHELAHGIIGFCDEKDVIYEQAQILARLVEDLLKEREDEREQESGVAAADRKGDEGHP